MKKKKIIEILLVILGISLITYPIISNYVSSYNQTIAITNYEDKIDKMTKEEKEKELEKARQYNEELEKITIVDLSLNNNEEANKVENTTTEKQGNASYLNVLNIGEVMAYISIPKIDIYLPIYHGFSEAVLQSGIGHSERTSLPVGGAGTHCVLAGHTGLARIKVFDDIDKLEIGDKFYIYVLGEVLAYEVDKIDIVEPNNTDMIKIEDNKDYVTLVTCTPHVLNTHRLLVRGSRVENTREQIDNGSMHKQEIRNKNKTFRTQIEEAKVNNKSRIYISIALAVILILVLLIAFRKDLKSKK